MSINQIEEFSTKLHVGNTPDRIVSHGSVRKAQEALLKRNMSDKDVALIDAIISHFICGRETRWS